MEMLWSLLDFVLKVAVIALALVVVIGAVANAAQRQKAQVGQLQIDHVSRQWRDKIEQLQLQLLEKKARKQAAKEAKQARKAARQQGAAKARLFVIDFNAGMEAKEVDALRREVSAVIALAKPQDQVLVRLESGGGTVNGYGLGAAQLQRLRDADLTLTVSVDRVAASGGYMMAAVAHELLAAPFALVGSIGVVAQLPNFHRWLAKHDIDFEQVTAGEYKRTLTLFGKNTDEGRAKFQQDLESIHAQFKAHLLQYRPQLDMALVGSGEYWTAQEALKLGLVDRLLTSDSYLMAQLASHEIYQVRYVNKKPWGERIGKQVSVMLSQLRDMMQK